jgi:hypothetical protein
MSANLEKKRIDALLALALSRHAAGGFTPPAGAEGDLLVFHAGLWESVIVPGAAGQLLTSNGVGVVPTFQAATIATFGADLALSTPTLQWVAAISGSGGAGGVVPLNVTTFQFGAGQANPTITQATTASVNAQTMTLRPQGSSAPAGNPGELLVDLQTAGVGGAIPLFRVHYNGAAMGAIGSTAPGSGELWLGQNIPGASNYALNTDNSNLFINNVGTTASTTYILNGATADVGVVGFWNFGVQFFLFGATAFGSGAGVIGISNRTTAPTTNPVGGGIQYAEAGAAVWRGSSGTTTMYAPA